MFICLNLAVIHQFSGNLVSGRIPIDTVHALPHRAQTNLLRHLARVPIAAASLYVSLPSIPHPHLWEHKSEARTESLCARKAPAAENGPTYARRSCRGPRRCEIPGWGIPFFAPASPDPVSQHISVPAARRS